jgi:hypothetical protein
MQAPSHLPAPIDDGACAHLPGLVVPSLLLPSTAGRLIDLSKRDAARTVVYCYSMTGVPGGPLPEGWDLIREREAAHRKLAPFATITRNSPRSRRNCSA